MEPLGDKAMAEVSGISAPQKSHSLLLRGLTSFDPEADAFSFNPDARLLLAPLFAEEPVG